MRRVSIAFVALGWLAGCSSSNEASPPTGSSGSPGTDAGVPQDASTTPTSQRCATPPCGDGKACFAANDCASGVCTSNTCVPTTCTDGVKNGDETDVDCGGFCIAGCAPTKSCKVSTDCLDQVCPSSGICAPPTSGDKLKNGNESDTDCGSSAAGRFDTHAPRCDAGKTCKADVDCKSAGCNLTTGTCAFARSCGMTNGGTTCGAGDVTSVTKSHEDCCTSAEVPVYTGVKNFANATKFRLDKYTVTAGRMRRFLDAVHGNVQGWVQANRANIVAPDQLPSTLDPYLPTGWIQNDSTDTCQGDSGGGPYPCNYGALAQMSGYRYNNEPGGNGGYACNMGQDAYGARTFYLTDAELAQLYPDPNNRETQHLVPRERLDQKALECANYYMLASFCAWDGGRLETLAEYNAAYGGNGTNGQTYPWGSDPTTRALGFFDSVNSNIYPNYNYNPPDYAGADGTDLGTGTTKYSVYNDQLSATDKSTLLLRLRRANAFYNYGNYITTDFFQALGAPEQSQVPAEQVPQSNDQSVIVAPPGRYTSGKGNYGHADLLGNVIEITATTVGGGAPSPTGQMIWARNGSYETAHFNQQTMTGGIFQKSMLTKYGRAGGRCARPTTTYPTTPLP